MRYLLVFIIQLYSFSILAQEIFRLDFEQELQPLNWQVSEDAEWGHELGEEGSNYFRFHPYTVKDDFTSLPYTLESGNYVLYFSWNEVGDINPDFVSISLKEDQQNWEEIKRFGGSETGGTNRTWTKDSVEIGDLSTNNYSFRFDYQSTGKYPSQYINLDNIYLVRRDAVTTVDDWIAKVDFSIYPNPATDNIVFTLNDVTNQNFDWKLFNTKGQLVLSGFNIGNGTHNIDVTHLQKGNYLLELYHPDGRKSEKLVIQ